MKRLMIVASVIAVTGIAACSSSDSVTPPDGAPSANLGSTGGPGGGDSSAGGPTSNPTSDGPIASFSLDPHSVNLEVGRAYTLAAIALDAKGVRVAKPLTWRSSNAAVVTVDPGLVSGQAVKGYLYGRAAGSAKIYVSVDGFSDSAVVTVVPNTTGYTDPAPGQPVNSPSPVSQFNLTVIALAGGPSAPGPDSSQHALVPGATISLFRIGGVQGDTLSQPQPAGTAVTDAKGEAKFSQLTGGAYAVHVVPPANSPYAEYQTGFGPPTSTDNTFRVLLARKK